MSVKYQDYYATLGVPKNASDDAIKKAYRKLARQYHPDVNKSAGAEAKFKSLSEAYEVLGDPAKRKRYDSLGPGWSGGQDFNGPPGGAGSWDFRQQFKQKRPGGGASPFGDFNFEGMGSGGGGGFSDFFESLFGGGGQSSSFSSGRGQRRQRSRQQWGSQRGADQESEINISLEDAFHGAVKTITLSSPDEEGGRSFDVKLPVGTSEGTKIRIPGKGGKGEGGGEDGDLYLRIHIQLHPLFKLNGRDLEEELRISPWEAVLGAEVELKTMEGLSRIRLKPGTQSGQRVRLKGKGLPAQKGGAPGDLYAVVSIVVPENPSPSEKELFKRLAETSAFKPRPS